MMKHDVAEEGFEVEAPPVFPNEEVEEDPSIVEGGGDGRENVIINNNGVPQQQKTWYSRTIGKVAILFVAVFAVCVAIGYGSGYGINEKILSNKAAASVSSAKNGAYETYDTPSATAKAAKSSSESKTSKASNDGSTKSSKTGTTTTTTSSTAVSTTIGSTSTATTSQATTSQATTSQATTSQATTTTTPQTTSETSTSSTTVSSTTTTQTTSEASTTSTSTVTSSTSTTPVAFCRRALREGEDPVRKDVPLERRLEIIKRMEPHGAKADATFSFMYDLISKESCDALVKFMDSSLECDIDSGIDIPAGVSSHGAEEMYDSWTPFEGGVSNQYNKKLFAKDIVEIIGAEETMKIIDYFHESLGNLNIDCMYLARHGDPGDELFNVPWHKDNYATMEITLNDDYDGGEVLHLNASGVHITDARPGSVTAHTDDIIHGITPNTNGAKYMLIIKHHFNRPDKQGVVRLSKDLVAEAVANHHV